ncbi:hypothetical protein QCB44_05530 [Thiomicrorhabdus sp. zzn3]|uniref:hypothetical protein n=1 Tax=Thiomicrorhabdus sp. zzn3 TaxID=3039775 RepID=UPI002436435E|nr:hypothetical protein [Thiomicrorhabdus sp. zzn3]MDG6778162.1 hypothetical protein [Thiomicrorhabdus sp. zzn3]
MIQKRSGVLLVAAWVMGGIGLVNGLLLEPIWFARFGSLVVLFAVMSEYALLHGELDVLYRRLEKVHAEDDMPDLTPSKWHRKKVWLTHVTVVAGTLIWGFGDLFL